MTDDDFDAEFDEFSEGGYVPDYELLEGDLTADQEHQGSLDLDHPGYGSGWS